MLSGKINDENEIVSEDEKTKNEDNDFENKNYYWLGIGACAFIFVGYLIKKNIK